MKKIAIIGAGAMGSAFTVPCIDNKNEVYLIGTHLENSLVDLIKNNNNHHPKLKINLSKDLKISKFENINSIFKSEIDIIVVAVSSLGINWFAKEISKYYKSNHSLILLTKGLSIENNKITTLSEKIKKILQKDGHENINISAIKGPCLASGLANKIRTGTVIANEDNKKAEFLKNIISTKYYSTEISTDVVGVEVCGAIKNIYSMLIGASEGLSSIDALKDIKSKFFLNTAASLVHRSISEMVRFVKHIGGKDETVYGLAGLGDLYVSAIGGRNSQMGKYLGEGYLYQEAKLKFMKDVTVEGAELALEIGPSILKNFKPNDYPLMFSIIETICSNKKLEIKW
jgi:glycerol-3-phosphate dehydrogenase (NAD(P)+)